MTDSDAGPVDLATAFAGFSELWSPRIVARVDDYDVKIARVEGEYVWHAHDETDEFFLVFEGELRLELEGRPDVLLSPGQVFVVPRGMRHRPVAAPGTQILLYERRGTVNSGDSGAPGTAGVDL